MSKAPWPPLPPVWVAPEFGAGAFGGSGGNGSGTFRGAGRWERRPPEFELSTDERTLDCATLRAELELLDQPVLALARTSSLRTDPCRTTFVFIRTLFFCGRAARSRLCLVGRPTPGSPVTPEGITGSRLDGEPGCPVAIAGISTGPTATGAGCSTGGGAGGWGTTESLGAIGGATST